jgi:hypothetical protein
MQHSDLKPVGTKCYTWHGDNVVEAVVIENHPDKELYKYTIEYFWYYEEYKKSFPVRDKLFEIWFTREEAEKALEEFNNWYIF